MKQRLCKGVQTLLHYLNQSGTSISTRNFNPVEWQVHKYPLTLKALSLLTLLTGSLHQCLMDRPLCQVLKENIKTTLRRAITLRPYILPQLTHHMSNCILRKKQLYPWLLKHPFPLSLFLISQAFRQASRQGGDGSTCTVKQDQKQHFCQLLVPGNSRKKTIIRQLQETLIKSFMKLVHLKTSSPHRDPSGSRRRHRVKLWM